MSGGGETSMAKQRYSSWSRPFRRQISPRGAEGFAAMPASLGQCQFEEGCERFEWRNGARFCREHWLLIYQQEQLPERFG